MKDRLIISNLSKSFGQLKLFDAITFVVDPGTILKLNGNNGSGKTTLMRIISSQIEDYGGEVLINGENIKDSQEEVFNKIQYLAPYPNLYENLTLQENIDFFVEIFKSTRPSMKTTLINLFKLESFVRYKVSDLSDGTKKKIAILIAFLTRPQFLIFDEPYTYLDSSSIKLLNDLIKEHVKEGGSLIVVDNSSGGNNLEFSDYIEL
ncbi:MAG: ATP-binding cassette domain-containing protein [Thermodesulfobacteriota bacterium]|nr:MAG: ABC transporter ATP-binding protein [Candidatus Dadabacteria bacterium]